METKTGIKDYLIEIKPAEQTHLPKQQKRQTKHYNERVMTFAVNDQKWKSAKEFCDKKGWTFMVLTEKELFGGSYK